MDKTLTLKKFIVELPRCITRRSPPRMLVENYISELREAGCPVYVVSRLMEDPYDMVAAMTISPLDAIGVVTEFLGDSYRIELLDSYATEAMAKRLEEKYCVAAVGLGSCRDDTGPVWSRIIKLGLQRIPPDQSKDHCPIMVDIAPLIETFEHTLDTYREHPDKLLLAGEYLKYDEALVGLRILTKLKEQQ